VRNRLLSAAFYVVVGIVVTVGAIDMALSWGRERSRD
jgi:hypothetical protein